MDIRKYAALQDVFIDNPFGTWRIIGFIDPKGQYHSLKKWKDVGKKDETAVRNIDKFKASLETT